jgi:hypothetical protein
MIPQPAEPIAPEPVVADSLAPDPTPALSTVEPTTAPPALGPGDALTVAPRSPGTGPAAAADEAGSPAPEIMAAIAGAGPGPAATPEPPGGNPAEAPQVAEATPADHPPPEPPVVTALRPAPPPPAVLSPTPPVVPLPPPRPVEPSAAPAAAPLPALVQRADEMLRLGDISAARRLYERAAVAGNGQAALALGRTHDPAFLASIHVRGIQGDRTLAISWYRRALALGVGEAREPLARIGPLPGE